MTFDLDAESRRIIAEYERREREMPADFYDLHHLRNLFMHQEHERLLADCLHRSGQIPSPERKILEVGCGHGNWLSVFESLGFSQQNISGVELGRPRAELASRRLPAADVRAGDAAKLPWEDHSFDVVFQRMMFTSILDPRIRRQAAAEMMRVVRPDGVIIWSDFFINPSNPRVCPLSQADVPLAISGLASQALSNDTSASFGAAAGASLWTSRASARETENLQCVLLWLPPA